MKNRFIRFILFSCFLGITVIAFSQNTQKPGSKTSGDVKQAPEYHYMLYLDSLLRINKGAKADTINVDQERNSSVNRNRNSGRNPILNYLSSSSSLSLFFQVLAIVFIVFLVYKLVLKNVLFSNRKNRYSTEIGEIGTTEPLEASQYNLLIRKAETNDQLNLAVKYYFLQVLKKLDELGVIQFSPDKTNQYYIREIGPATQQKKFASLTRIYEYVWYGKFEINKDQYSLFKKEFEKFLSIIN